MPKTCLEYGDHNMICHEPYGHDDDGWHYDRIDDVTWRNGRHMPEPRDGEALLPATADDDGTCADCGRKLIDHVVDAGGHIEECPDAPTGDGDGETSAAGVSGGRG